MRFNRGYPSSGGVPTTHLRHNTLFNNKLHIQPVVDSRKKTCKIRKNLQVPQETPEGPAKKLSSHFAAG